jgi:sugar/nucleoside kinase (ribokinase family)
VRALGVIGHLSRDVVAGAPPQIGGGPWHAARALRLIGADAILFAKCGERAYHRKLAALGSPVSFTLARETTSFTFSYDEHGLRTMGIESISEPWRIEDIPARLLQGVEWLHVAPLLRDDFDPDVLEWLARGRRILLDGQGLVRPRKAGPLVLDGDFDPELLRHVTALKLAQEEADVVGEVDVPELIVTDGMRGATVNGEHVPAHVVSADPTGAGDAFAVAYAASRAAGQAPVSAARRATALVAALLSG